MLAGKQILAEQRSAAEMEAPHRGSKRHERISIATVTNIELETAIRLRMVAGRLHRRLRQTEAADSAGLTPARVSALLNIERNGPLRLSELAAAEGLNPTMLSRMIADLVDAGLLERSPDPDDRRSAWVSATDAGTRLAEQMRQQRTETVEAALAVLNSDERLAIERALPALETLVERLPDGRRA